METQNPRRSLRETIQEFQYQKRKLNEGKELLDAKLIAVMERDLKEAFDNILDFSPKVRTEAVGLVDFLLTELADLNSEAILFDQINSKILEVVEQAYSPRLIDTD